MKQLLKNRVTELTEVRNNYQANKMFSSADDEVNNWLKEPVEVRPKKSSRSSSLSKHSCTSSKSRSSTKKNAMQEKLRVAELLAEATFLENKKTAQHQADELPMQE